MGDRPTAHVICCGRDCAPYLVKCLASIRAQTYRPLAVTVVDDASVDEQARRIVRDVDQLEGWRGIVNETQVGATANFWRAFQSIDYAPNDVVCLIDADDWWTSEHSVATIMEFYEDNPDCWFGYGSYVPVPYDEACPPALPYPDEVVRARSFRTWSNNVNHPLTFRGFLLDQLSEADMRLADGTWVPGSYDEAIAYPLLTYAGPAAKCMPAVTYAYRSDNPASCNLVMREAMESAGRELRARPKEPRLYKSDNGLTLAPEDRAAVITQTMLDTYTGWCVETGTGYGDMAYRVASLPWVERVVTIEADAERYASAVAKLVGCPNVLPVLGDSRDVLRAIVAEVPAAVWWLDAHRDDWWTGDPDTVCPILDELFLILSQPVAHAVLIDDARLFGQATGYPTLEAVESHVANLAEAAGRGYGVAVSHDIVRVVPQ